MVSLAQRVQLRNSIFIVVLFFIIQGCNNSATSLSFDMDKVKPQLRNGVMYKDCNAYTGHLYKLNKNGHDSLYSAFYKNGLLNGSETKWFENGKLMEKRSFQNNTKNGIHTGFWLNGNKRFEYHFVNGFYEGLQFEWFDNGRLYQRKTYLKGQEEGLQQEWTQNGKLLINYESHNGRQYGNIGKKHCASVWREDIYAKPAK